MEVSSSMAQTVGDCKLPRTAATNGGLGKSVELAQVHTRGWNDILANRFPSTAQGELSLIPIKNRGSHHCKMQFCANVVGKNGIATTKYILLDKGRHYIFRKPWMKVESTRKMQLGVRAEINLAAGLDVINDLGLDTLTFLAATVLVVPSFKAMKASPILGFFLSGVVLNQLGLIRNILDVKALSELGILFLVSVLMKYCKVKRLACSD